MAIAFAAFVSLGLPDGVLGVAWPSMRSTFGLPVSQLGSILLAVMTGYLASSFGSGAIVARHGVGRLLAWSNALVAVSCAGYALATAWPTMLVWGLVGGLGAGASDAGINVHSAERFSPRLVSWLHASWGAGAALGPLIMTAVLGAGLAWPWGYTAVATVLAVMSLCFFATIGLWGGPRGVAGGAPAPRAAATFFSTLRRSTLRRPVIWAHMAVFFLYLRPGSERRAVGVQPAHRGAPDSAGRGGDVGGRLLGVPHRGPAPTLAGLALLGISLAPIFPMLIASTPTRLGAEHAAHAVGFQVSAGALGAAAVPGAAGLIAQWRGVEEISIVLVANVVALIVLHESANASLARHARGG